MTTPYQHLGQRINYCGTAVPAVALLYSLIPTCYRVRYRRLLEGRAHSRKHATYEPCPGVQDLGTAVDHRQRITTKQSSLPIPDTAVVAEPQREDGITLGQSAAVHATTHHRQAPSTSGLSADPSVRAWCT